MNKRKKNIMIGIAVFLWVFVLIPCMVWGCDLYDVYNNGAYLSTAFFDKGDFYIGWEAVIMEIKIIQIWGGGLLWFYYSLFTLAYTLFLIVKIKISKKK
ncbi:hypothetical protein D6853_06590 [Butyrivibrio sp. X503]|uniref:hypothetical protein n=1 Tax=Butyrivibrio sp. X503 TaxID=2364878 RepID=UPI000EAAB45F|nr:hypothetical protein [Butyrivibrio sp. X503]RKM56450.1 hypothetical protein D6853_06590 [Butyrivibrio sp. X503]